MIRIKQMMLGGVVLAGMSLSASAQMGPVGGPMDGPPGFQGRGQFGGEGLDQVKTQIRASDEEWRVIGAKLRKVQSARQNVDAFLDSATSSNQGGGFGGPGGGDRGDRGGPGGRGGGGANDAFNGPAGAGAFNGRGGPGGRGGFGGRGGGFGPPGDFGPDGGMVPDGVSTTQPFARGDFEGRGNFGGPGGPGGRGGRGGRGGGPGGMGGRGGAVTMALTELQTALSDSTTTPEQLEQKVAAVRAARVKAVNELKAAQKDLLQILTDDQAATLVSLGYLD